MDYNVPGGKLNRGLSVIDTVEILKRQPLTDNEYVKAAVLGWCVELVWIPISDFTPVTDKFESFRPISLFQMISWTRRSPVATNRAGTATQVSA